MENDKEKTKIDAPWWRDGLIIFAKVSAYIAIPVIIASYIGKYLDQRYNTGNLLFLSTEPRKTRFARHGACYTNV
jgi:hypothetical protein